MDRLQEIKSRLDKATPGPWKFNGRNRVKADFSKEHDCRWKSFGTTACFCWEPIADVKRQGNGELIASAPGDMKWLIEELEKRDAALKEISVEFPNGKFQYVSKEEMAICIRNMTATAKEARQ